MTMLSVVIPALNEESAIGAIIARVLGTRLRLLEEGIDELEVIVVDDGSCDGTADVVRGFPEVRLVQHVTNQGYGAALKTGFWQAHGDLLAFLDADATYPPESLPELCKVAMTSGSDIVVGSRMLGARNGMPRVRRLGNVLFAGLLSLVCNSPITDSASGMRVLRRDILECLYPLPDGLHFTPTMSTRAVHERLKMVEVPIPYTERVGRSKLRVLHDGIRFLQTIIWTALGYNPVRILGLVGTATVAVALAIGLGLVAQRLRGVTTLGPWGVFAAFVSLVAAVSGISVFSLGATFNYLVSLFHKRKTRQGLFGRPLFRRPLEGRFGLAGILAASLGVALSAITLGLGIRGWPITRLWLYQLAAALFILAGLQLFLSWVLMRVLGELSQRESQVCKDRRQDIPTNLVRNDVLEKNAAAPGQMS